MHSIGIVGAGFSGTMLAANLILQAQGPCKIFLIDHKAQFNKGIAYAPNSKAHVLNVVASKMSAFPNQPNHFIHWLAKQPSYLDIKTETLQETYVTREVYGNYLADIWAKCKIIALEKALDVEEIHEQVADVNIKNNENILTLTNGKTITVEQLVFATGNAEPSDPPQLIPEVRQASAYIKNPWQSNALLYKDQSPIFILGTGLTMVDTVLGLRENGYNGVIYALSRSGYHLQPQTKLPNNIKIPEFHHSDLSLLQWVSQFNSLRKSCQKKGIAPYFLVDQLRPFNQKIWQSLSPNEKETFLNCLQSKWSNLRHRLPSHVHQIIANEITKGTLVVHRGQLNNVGIQNSNLIVKFFEQKSHAEIIVTVQKFINCTGPQDDLTKNKTSILSKLHQKGLFNISPHLKTIAANPSTFQILDHQHNAYPNIYAIGSALRGELWESTAVNELRVQAYQLALSISEKTQEPAPTCNYAELSMSKPKLIDQSIH